MTYLSIRFDNLAHLIKYQGDDLSFFLVNYIHPVKVRAPHIFIREVVAYSQIIRELVS